MNLYDLLGPSVDTPSEGLWAQVQAEDQPPQDCTPRPQHNRRPQRAISKVHPREALLGHAIVSQV